MSTEFKSSTKDIVDNNPWRKNRGTYDIENPMNILADQDGPITPELVILFNGTKWGMPGSGPILPDGTIYVRKS